MKLRAIYSELLGDVPTGLVLPFEPSWSRAVWHLYVVRTAQRNELQEHLTKAGIGTGIHYPVPVHLQKPYRAMGFKEGDFPVAEKAAAQVLSLPMYPGLSLAQQNRVVEEIRRFRRHRREPSVHPASGECLTGSTTTTYQQPGSIVSTAGTQLVYESQIEEPTVSSRPAPKKILIDLDNSPHVPCVLTIIEGFKRFYFHSHRDAWLITTVPRKSPGPRNPSC